MIPTTTLNEEVVVTDSAAGVTYHGEVTWKSKLIAAPSSVAVSVYDSPGTKPAVKASNRMMRIISAYPVSTTMLWSGKVMAAPPCVMLHWLRPPGRLMVRRLCTGPQQLLEFL